MIPKSWFNQRGFDDLRKANRRIWQLLMIGRELDGRTERLEWMYQRSITILHERTGLSYEAIDDLVWEREEVEE